MKNKPLVMPVNKLEEQLYNDMIVFRKQMKVIKQILEIKDDKK